DQYGQPEQRSHRRQPGTIPRHGRAPSMRMQASGGESSRNPSGSPKHPGRPMAAPWPHRPRLRSAPGRPGRLAGSPGTEHATQETNAQEEHEASTEARRLTGTQTQYDPNNADTPTTPVTAISLQVPCRQALRTDHRYVHAEQ